MKESVTRALQKSFAGASITVLTDLEAGLAAAGEGPAIILIMGTGSAAFGRNLGVKFARRWRVRACIERSRQRIRYRQAGDRRCDTRAGR